MKFTEGQYVKVKDGTILQETGEAVMNWVGEITDVFPDDKTCCITLDAITLDSLSDEYLKDSLDDGTDPYEYTFEFEELTPTERRDTDEMYEEAASRMSDRLVELDDSEEEDAEHQLLVKQWIEEFTTSHYFSQLTEYQQSVVDYVVESFSDLLYNYEDATLLDCTPHQVENICIYMVPKKITDDAIFFENYGDVLMSFFTFLAEKNYIEKAKVFAHRVAKIKKEIPKRAKDPSNWGMAKTIGMQMKDAGIDVSDEKKIASFIENYNHNLSSPFPQPEQQAPPQTRKNTPLDKIGRNDKVNVKYPDGTIKIQAKFKTVEQDLLDGKCELC